MNSPYSGLPARQFWRTGVRDADWSVADGLYRKKFPITNATRIMTAGSCFAQNIARHFNTRGYSLIDAEPAPSFIPDLEVKNFGYGLYSARYGNIYTVRQLLQLVREALGKSEPQDIIWERDGRYYDALRPSVEPQGLASPEEVRAHRRDHLVRVRAALEQVDLLVFTFGLTEAWVHRQSGTVYPTAPGTIAGTYDPSRHAFENFSYKETVDDFLRVRRLLKRLRPDIKFLITVSPVPLTASAENAHVLCSTVHSKSILRAVTGALTRDNDDIDYFPSYELIATPFVGSFYDASKRTVTEEGVEMAMALFFKEHGSVTPLEPAPSPRINPRRARAVPPRREGAVRDTLRDAVICDDILLEAFARE